MVLHNLDYGVSYVTKLFNNSNMARLDGHSPFPEWYVGFGPRGDDEKARAAHRHVSDMPLALRAGA